MRIKTSLLRQRENLADAVAVTLLQERDAILLELHIERLVEVA